MIQTGQQLYLINVSATNVVEHYAIGGSEMILKNSI